MIKLEMTTIQASAFLQILDSAVRANGLNAAETLVIVQPVVAQLITDYRLAVETEQLAAQAPAAPAK
jgi:hypothetical protein